MSLFNRSLLDLEYWPGHSNTSDQKPAPRTDSEAVSHTTSVHPSKLKCWKHGEVDEACSTCDCIHGAV